MNKLLLTTWLVFLGLIASAQNQTQLNLVKQQLVSSGCTYQDVEELVITSSYIDNKTGIEHIYFKQKVNGFEVFNAVGSMHRYKQELIAFNHNFLSNIKTKLNATQPKFDFQTALSYVSQAIEVSVPAKFDKTENTTEKNVLKVNLPQVASKPIELKIGYWLVNNSAVLAYQCNWSEKNSPNWWNIRVDAETGGIVDKTNLNLSCQATVNVNPFYGFDALAQTSTMRHTSSLKKTTSTGTYLAYPLAVESPAHGNREILENVYNNEASPYGWHDLNGIEGADTFTTAGNNVFAYEDGNADNEPGDSPLGGDSLKFVFNYNTNEITRSYTDAATTNLFVRNNFLHDVLYHYGFDEESGNFQFNNYDKGGLGFDHVLAESQDGGGVNNANFATPDDGENPRMQMYIWGGNATFIAYQNLNNQNDSAFYLPAQFGRRDFDSIRAPMVLAQEINTNSTLGCDSLPNYTGKIVLVDRGTCSFIQKAKNVQASGALAMVVVNTANAALTSMPGFDSDLTIPCVMISYNSGDKIKQLLNIHDSLVVTLKSPLVNVGLDASFDNGVITHEYAHGLTNRLTGGPLNSECLQNAEQPGEGWSDFFALVLTGQNLVVNPEEGRGIATWLANQSIDSVGIRNYKYATSLAINPTTYNSIKTLSIPHGVGSVWCAMLYDMYWKLIETHGYDSNLYTGTGGNNKAIRLVVEALKLQPCRPGFVDARNAILNANKALYGGEDSLLIWEVFARRGLGFSAKQGSTNNRSDGTEAFDLPKNTNGLPLINQSNVVKCWPNPSSGKITIDLPNKQRGLVSIIDYSGKVVYEQDLSDEQSIILPHTITSGLYFVKVKTAQGDYISKLMISK